MHGAVTHSTSGISARSPVSVPFGRPTAATQWPFTRNSLRRFGRIAAGVLMIIVFCLALLTLINASGPGIEIISSDVPSVADVEDWLLWRDR